MSHGTRSAYKRGCRCAPCTAANTEYGRRRREERRSVLKAVNGITVNPNAEHGALVSYVIDGCRCDECRSAYTAYMTPYALGRRINNRQQRVMRDGKMVHQSAPHGTYYAYQTFACRCDQCVSAKRVSRAGYENEEMS